MSVQSPITMFGAYVSNLSVSLGWGGQGGSMQLTLVEDPKNGVTIPKRGGKVFNGGERDGIIAPPTGTACYFKYGGFYFGGIFQRWTYKRDAVGGATYDVILESPSKFMDGVQLIIENFNGATDYFASSYNDNFFSTNAVNVAAGLPASHVVYGESSNELHNVYNLFGFFENPGFGSSYPPSLSPGVGKEPSSAEDYERLEFVNFGSSRFNSSGTPLRELWWALDKCAKIRSRTIWGGPMRFGDPSGGKYGVTEYSLNVDEALNIYKELGVDVVTDLKDIRIQGPVKSINQFVSEAAEYHQWDYFFTVEPLGGKSAINNLPEGGGLIQTEVEEDDEDGVPYKVKKQWAVIKLKATSKASAPEPDRIQNFIDAELDKPDSEKRLMSYSNGKEWADATTQKIIWGARRSRYLEINGRINFLSGAFNPSVGNQGAVWGRTTSIIDQAYNIVGPADVVYGNPLRIARPIFIDVEQRNAAGQHIRQVLPYMIKPFELRMALAGKEVWKIYKTMEIISGTSLQGYNLLTSPFTAKMEPTKELLNLLKEGCGNEFDLLQTNLKKANNRWDAAKQKLGDQIFSAISSVAENSYKQEYYVSLPNENSSTNYNIYYGDDESQDVRSWRVASSAYKSPPPVFDVSYFDGSGKMQPVVGYAQIGRNGGQPDFSSLGSDYAIGVQGASGLIVTQKGGVQGEDRWNPLYGQFGVLCRGVQLKEYDAITTPDFGLTVLAKLLYGIDIEPEKYTKKAKTNLQFQIPPDVMEPAYFGIPQESERFNYGPWITVSGAFGGDMDANGKATAEEISQLAPETYGSYGLLRAVGMTMTQVANAKMHQSESGYMEFAGAPDYNIGERFVSDGPYVTGMDISVDATGGVTTSYKFNTWTSEFGKLAKYNIDRIAKINKNSWAASQALRGRITKPSFPAAKFEKTDFKNGKQLPPPNFSGFGMHMIV